MRNAYFRFTAPLLFCLALVIPCSAMAQDAGESEAELFDLPACIAACAEGLKGGKELCSLLTGEVLAQCVGEVLGQYRECRETCVGYHDTIRTKRKEPKGTRE